MTAITQEQISQIKDLATDAVEKVLKDLNLTKQHAKWVHARGGEVTDTVHKAAKKAIKKILSGYEPKPLAEQVTTLKKLYPQLKDSGMMNPGKLPVGAEGWFLIPNIWKKNSPLNGSYNDSVVQMLEHLKEAYGEKNYHNYCEGKMGPNRLRQTDHSKEVFEKLSEEQGHPDILIIPAQFGTKHGGSCVFEEREIMLGKSQFGLGVFVTGIIFLMHPELLEHYNDLRIDCAGDEYRDEYREYGDPADLYEQFLLSPCFRFFDGKVRFGTLYFSLAYGDFVSASGFFRNKRY